MPPTTNHLVAVMKKLATPAAVVGAFALGAAIFAGHGSVHAASAMDNNSVEALTALDHAMEAVASRVTPAVVNVAVTSRSSSKLATSDGQMQGLPPGLQQFFGPMLQLPSQPQIEHGVGSGIIISPDGYIVTNDHVVDGATSIKVTLNDRRILSAKVVGADKLTDLAVLKVNASDLPTIVWGDSTKLQPGQTVLAFGSPFGYFQFSVTRGIVSAVNRPNPYSDDARKPGGYIRQLRRPAGQRPRRTGRHQHLHHLQQRLVRRRGLCDSVADRSRNHRAADQKRQSRAWLPGHWNERRHAR